MLAAVPDPRAANVRHDPSEMSLVASPATQTGAEMAGSGGSKWALLRRMLTLLQADTGPGSIRAKIKQAG
jgi:hypothetical protein